MVGAGGIGCELLKTLLLSGFRDVELVDMDTIEMSNLNRQFLFRKEHVGKSKAQVAREAVLRFCPEAKVVAHHGNIKSNEFDIEFFRRFDVVLNGLDNLEARRHVNRLCLAAGVPLVESGTTGYLGQVTVHVKGITECFECQPKPAPKSFPVCTIRNTPDKPIHCIVWAKELLFNRLFGKQDDVSDLDEQRQEGDAASTEQSKDSTFFLRRNEESIPAYVERIFERVFSTDISKVAEMDELWKTREAPKVLSFPKVLQSGVPIVRDQNVKGTLSACKLLEIGSDHSIWSPQECAQVFATCIQIFLECRTSELGEAVFDKDDRLAVEFVTAAANLRSYNYGIPPQSLFDAKGMAGNIVHAVATTNAIVAGLIVMECMKVLEKELSKNVMTYVLQFPSNKKLLQPVDPAQPNQMCYVCRQAQLMLSLSTIKTTLNHVVSHVVKGRLSLNSPSIIVGDNIIYEEGDCLEPEETALYKRNLGKILQDLPGGGVVHNSILAVSDYDQRFECTIVICHVDELDEDKYPEGYNLEGKLPKSSNGTDGHDEAHDSGVDDIVCSVEPSDVTSVSKRQRLSEDAADAKRQKVENSL